MCYSTEGRQAPGEDFGAEAAAEALTRYTDKQLEQAIVTEKRWVDAKQAQLALMAAELDRRGAAEARHVLTTKQWLAMACRMTKPAASSLVRTGQMLSKHDSTRTRSAAGEITSDGVRTLVALAGRHPDEFAMHGAPLVDAATYLNPRELKQAANYWTQQVDYPSAVAEVASKRRRRRLSINQTWDGMWSISGELDPESGHVVATAINAQAEPGALDPDDGRTRAQRNADALADISRFALDHNATVQTSGGSKPHVTVEVTWDTLAKDSALDAAAKTPSRLPEVDGMPVDAETMRRLACDSGVVRMITGPTGEVLDVGRRTRTVPPALRRLLDRRDGGCTWTGCDAPAGWTDAHHIVHWADGGPTNPDNLRLLCRRHHTAIHEPEVGARAGPAP